MNKSKVALGFMVAGIFALVFGTVLAVVGPLIIDEQIVKVRPAVPTYAERRTGDKVRPADAT